MADPWSTIGYLLFYCRNYPLSVGNGDLAGFLIQHIPHAQHIHDAQSAVVQAVTGADIAGAFIPQVTAMVGTDVALEAAVVVSLQDVQNAGLAVAVTMAGLGEVAIVEVLDVTNVGKGNAVAVLANDLRNIVVGVGVQRTGAQGQAVVGMVHHLQEAVDILAVDQQTGQTEDIPWGIVHMDGHLHVALLAGGHDGFQEILQVGPQLLVVHIGVVLEQLVQLGHTLRLPAGEGHIVLLGEVQNVFCHGVVVVLDHALLIEQGSGAIANFVEQVGTGPVEDRHEVVADDLHAELGQVADALLVVLDQAVPSGLADLDVVMDVDRFHHIAVEAVGVELVHDLLDLVFFPNFTGHFVVQSPNNAGDTGDLLDVGQLDLVIAFAVPTETHVHRHK